MPPTRTARRTASGALAAIVASCAVVAGCAGSGGPLPRPVALPTDGLAPCSALAPGQQARLGLRPGTPLTAPAVGGRPEEPGCVWRGRDYGYGVSLVATGVETSVGKPDTELVEIGGFGAVRGMVHALDAVAPTCQVVIDTAPGRSVRVQAQDAAPDRRHSGEELCRAATDAATAVLTTLTNR